MTHPAKLAGQLRYAVLETQERVCSAEMIHGLQGDLEPSLKRFMKANLPQREQELLQFWNDMQLYTALRQKAHGKAKYILHDGLPYANGRIHEGHVLNKILKRSRGEDQTDGGF